MEDVAWRALTKEWEARYFYYAKITDEDLKNMEIYEGQGWTYIHGSQDLDLIELWRPVVGKLYEILGS